MAIDGLEKDPVKGLIEFVDDIKPYHTKVIEVLVEYIYTDVLLATFSETLFFDIGVNLTDINLGCDFGYDDYGYDILAKNIIPGNTIASIIGNVIALDISQGNVSALYPTSKTVEIVDSTGNDGFYTVTSSIYTGSQTEITLNVSPPSTIPDGQITSYISDIIDLPASVYDDTELNGCLISNGTQPSDSLLSAVMFETLTIQIEELPQFPSSFDDFLSSFDDFEGGYDMDYIP